MPQIRIVGNPVLAFTGNQTGSMFFAESYLSGTASGAKFWVEKSSPSSTAYCKYALREDFFPSATVISATAYPLAWPAEGLVNGPSVPISASSLNTQISGSTYYLSRMIPQPSGIYDYECHASVPSGSADWTIKVALLSKTTATKFSFAEYGGGNTKNVWLESDIAESPTYTPSFTSSADPTTIDYYISISCSVSGGWSLIPNDRYAYAFYANSGSGGYRMLQITNSPSATLFLNHYTRYAGPRQVTIDAATEAVWDGGSGCIYGKPVPGNDVMDYFSSIADAFVAATFSGSAKCLDITAVSALSYRTSILSPPSGGGPSYTANLSGDYWQLEAVDAPGEPSSWQPGWVSATGPLASHTYWYSSYYAYLPAHYTNTGSWYESDLSNYADVASSVSSGNAFGVSISFYNVEAGNDDLFGVYMSSATDRSYSSYSLVAVTSAAVYADAHGTFVSGASSMGLDPIIPIHNKPLYPSAGYFLPQNSGTSANKPGIWLNHNDSPLELGDMASGAQIALYNAGVAPSGAATGVTNYKFCTSIEVP